MIFKKSRKNGQFALLVGNDALIMSREEAEKLFVDIGHELQDDDVTRYNESGQDDEQPDIYTHGHSVERFTDG